MEMPVPRPAAIAALALAALVFNMLALRAAPSGPRGRRFVAGVCLALSFFLCGALAARADRDRRASPLRSLPSALDFSMDDGRIVRLAGRFTGDPELSDGLFRAQIEAESIEDGGERAPFQANVLITWPRGPEAESDSSAFPLLAGRTMTATARLRRPRNYGNPGAFDFEEYVARRGAAAIGFIKSPRLIALLPGEGDRSPATTVRRRLDRILRRLYSGPDGTLTAEGAILRACVLGGRSGLPLESERALVSSGVYHILAVSGLQVAVLAGALYGLLSLLPLPRRLALLLSFSGVALYGAVVSPSASVQRAVLMAAFAAAARLLNRRTQAIRALVLAGLVLLAVRPSELSDPGFQLTFAATLGLLLFSKPFSSQLPARWGLSGLLAASLAAQAATWILVAIWFHRIVPYGIAANLLAVPLGSAAVILGLALLPADLLFGPLTRFVGALAGLSVRGMLAVASVPVEGTPLSFRVAEPGALVILTSSASLLLLAARPARSRRVGVALLAVSLAAAMAGPLETGVRCPCGEDRPTANGLRDRPKDQPCGARPLELTGNEAADPRDRGLPLRGQPGAQATESCSAGSTLRTQAGSPADKPPVSDHPPPSAPCLATEHERFALSVDLIDVGQGDAILVGFPNGESMLVDGGGIAGSSFDIGARVLVPDLERRGLRRIGRVVLTHGHEDHGAGLREVLRDMQVGELISPDAPEEPLRDELEALARRQGSRVMRIRRGYVIREGETTVECLSPMPRPVDDPNADSIVLRVSHGGSCALLMGDAGARIEEALVSAGIEGCDFLKVGHHGSATSSSPALLRAIDPRVAGISVGSAARFGHPSPAVLDRLARSRALIQTTFRSGAVRFTACWGDLHAGSLAADSPLAWPGPCLAQRLSRERPRSRSEPE